MALSKQQAKALLRTHNLRTTSPRLAVLTVLSSAQKPLANSEVLRELGEVDWDPATVYRNLVKLEEAGVVQVVSRAGGMSRYALAVDAQGLDTTHAHPHFVCTDCGTVSCLPEGTIPPLSGPGRWKAAIEHASVQLQGSCPDCL